MDEKTEAALMRAGHQIQSLQDRITELEQQLADAREMLDDTNEALAIEVNAREAAETKLTERDKLLEQWDKDAEAMLAKLQERER